MLETYAERWALITGASSGIGAEFARKLAARGMHLVLTARRSEPMEELAADLHTHHGTRTEIIRANLADPEEVNRLTKDIAAKHIEVELLVNNAGFGVVGDVEHTDPRRILEMVQLNISALTALTYHYLPAMVRRQHGAIINVASVAAFQPVAYMAAYAASKAFVLHFSEALWAEVRDRGVTVMALCPGVTRTTFFENADVPHWLKKQRSQTVDQVVKAALKGLTRRRQYWIPGWWNYWLSLLVRLAPRKMVVKQSMEYFRPKSDPANEPEGQELEGQGSRVKSQEPEKGKHQ